MKQFIKIVLLSALAFCVATPVMAKKRVKIKVYNCSAKDKTPTGYKYKVTVCVYNGADTSKSTAKHRKTLIPGRRWDTYCNGKNMIGQNTYRCKVYFTTGGQACPFDVGKKAQRVPGNASFYISYDATKKKFVGKRGSKTHCAVKP